MGRTLGISAVAAAALLAGAAGAAPLPAGALDKVDAVARAWVAGGHAPGLTIAVMKDGKVVLDKAYGQAELENGVAAQPDTVFRIGSVSKQFTAAAVLKLAEEGRLSLDDKVSKYYPDFPRGGEVTIRQMLNHTAGLHNYLEVEPAAFVQLMRDYSTDEFVQHIARLQPLYDFDPGTGWHYSNSGFFIAGGIVEKVSGQSLHDYLRDHIFKPAGITHTALDLDGPVVPLRASGYEVLKTGGYRPAGYVSMTVPGGAGALRSTAGDLVRWEDALLAGRVIGPAQVKDMTTPARLADGRLANSNRVPAPKTGAPTAAQPDYALGLEIGDVAGHRRVSHGGNIYGFNAALEAFPDDGLIWVVLSNAGTGASGLAPKIESALLGVAAARKGGPAD